MTHWPGDDHVRRAHAFRIVAYQTPRGVGSGVLPRDQPTGPAGLDRASESNTPTSKSVIIRLERSGTRQSINPGVPQTLDKTPTTVL